MKSGVGSVVKGALSVRFGHLLEGGLPVGSCISLNWFIVLSSYSRPFGVTFGLSGDGLRSITITERFLYTIFEGLSSSLNCLTYIKEKDM